MIKNKQERNKRVSFENTLIGKIKLNPFTCANPIKAVGKGPNVWTQLRNVEMFLKIETLNHDLDKISECGTVKLIDFYAKNVVC